MKIKIKVGSSFDAWYVEFWRLQWCHDDVEEGDGDFDDDDDDDDDDDKLPPHKQAAQVDSGCELSCKFHFYFPS